MWRRSGGGGRAWASAARRASRYARALSNTSRSKVSGLRGSATQARKGARGHPPNGSVGPQERQPDELWHVMPGLGCTETAASCASSHWYLGKASRSPPQKAPVRAPAVVKGYQPPQEHPPRMLPGMATLPEMPGMATWVLGTATEESRWDATDTPLLWIRTAAAQRARELQSQSQSHCSL